MHIKIFYQTHLTEGQWSYINKVFFENDCRKRKYSLRSIFEEVLFILVGRCQCRMLPHDMPPWQDVYYFFRFSTRHPGIPLFRSIPGCLDSYPSVWKLVNEVRSCCGTGF